MFQTHCYDAWLDEASRHTKIFVWSQLGGTFPAPLFLFLAGMSFALLTEKLWRKNLSVPLIAAATIRRGAEVLAFGLLFRLQEYVIALGWAPWSDLLRVDILNEIGVSLILTAIACLIFYRGQRTQVRMTIISIAIAWAISLLSPLMWTSWRPDWLPWPIESYINGVHNSGSPQPHLFPIFPWCAFAFAGLAAGFSLQTGWAQKAGSRAFLAAAGAGGGLIFLGRWINRQPYHLYATDDFWHTSPSFFLIRAGFLLLFLGFAYAWCRWVPRLWGFSPLVQLGRTSLLVYWVHIEFVYGRFSILRRNGMGIPGATLGLAMIFGAMLALSIVRAQLSHRKAWKLVLSHGLSGVISFPAN